jgi:hypothetical protein
MVQKIEVAGKNSVTAATQKTLQTGGLITADDYDLQEAYLITSTAKTNIKNLMVEISYYEDILTGVCSGNILITDSINLIDRLGMTGFDYLKLKFSKSDNASNFYSIEKYFRVYKVGERLLTNNSTETYTLHFCTEEFFLSQQIKVSRSYPGKKISEIIYDILSRDLLIDKKYIRLQETEGIYDFVLPYKNPYQTIHWLSKYAKPIGKKGADFVFYENAEGYNFYSLQNLFTQSAYNTYIYMPRNLGDKFSGLRTSEIARNLIGLKSYVFLNTFDSLYGTITGAFANRVYSIDPLTRTYRITDFNYEDYFENATTLNKHSVTPKIKNRLGKTSTESYEAVVKVVTSNANQKKAVGISEEPWAVANDVFVENYVPHRSAQIALSHYSRVKFAVAGDPNLTVGMILEVFLPSNRGGDGTGYNTGEVDEFNSGRYMITAVRHIIDSNRKYETVVEVVKDSYASSVDTYRNTDEIEKAIRSKI